VQKNELNGTAVQSGCVNPLIRFVFNLVWWIPIVLAFTGHIDYATGFVTFGLITAMRLVANLYRNNVLSPKEAIYFPLRA